MSKTTVVNLRKEPYDIYIGRPSIFCNPYRIGIDGDRDEVLEMFREYIHTKPDIIAKAKKLMPGKRLGCYCKPLPCHGDIWLEILAED